MSDKPQILDLDAELERTTVRHKGTDYEIRNRSELSILEAQRFATLLKKYDELTDEELTEEIATQIGDALQQIAAVLVVDPPQEGFPDQHCAAILSFWTEQHRDADPPPAPRRKPQDRQPKKKTASTGAR